MLTEMLAATEMEEGNRFVLEVQLFLWQSQVPKALISVYASY